MASLGAGAEELERESAGGVEEDEPGDASRGVALSRERGLDRRGELDRSRGSGALGSGLPAKGKGGERRQAREGGGGKAEQAPRAGVDDVVAVSMRTPSGPAQPEAHDPLIARERGGRAASEPRKQVRRTPSASTTGLSYRDFHDRLVSRWQARREP